MYINVGPMFLGRFFKKIVTIYYNKLAVINYIKSTFRSMQLAVLLLEIELRTGLRFPQNCCENCNCFG
jgi:hypothetical protein